MSGIAPLQFIRGRRVKDAALAKTPKPEWLKVRAPGSPNYLRLRSLIPDFQGHEAPLRSVLEARPDILNHNTETVPRLYRQARPGGKYARALELLDRARRWAPDIPTKTGLMVGLGETTEEVVEVLRD